MIKNIYLLSENTFCKCRQYLAVPIAVSNCELNEEFQNQEVGRVLLMNTWMDTLG
jgi:hypothetical protein